MRNEAVDITLLVDTRNVTSTTSISPTLAVCFRESQNLRSTWKWKVPVRFWLSLKQTASLDVYAIDINATWLSASIATCHLNSTPDHLGGWCQAERHRTLYVPLCPDTFRYYMQEMRFSRKAGYFRNCCNAIEWRMLILSLGPTWLQPIMSGKRIPCRAMFGSLLWNWKHCLQVYCVTSF